MAKYTVYSYTEDGQILSDWVEADEGIGAFPAAVAKRPGTYLNFIVAVPGHLNEDNGVVFPGDSVVDSDTVAEQPEVFGDIPEKEG